GLAGGPEHDGVRVEDERRVADLDELGHVVERPCEVDVWMVARPEHPELTIEPDVQARWLDAGRVVRLDADAPPLDLGTDVAVGQDHQPVRIRARSASHVATVSSASATACRS